MKPRFQKSAEAKSAGWYSRRHEDRDAHERSRRRKADRKAQRRAEALERAANRAKRSVQEQLALIAERPGESKRERARLETL